MRKDGSDYKDDRVSSKFKFYDFDKKIHRPVNDPVNSVEGRSF